MKNKLEACNRTDPIELCYTNGGIRVYCQAALYELLRVAVHSMYTNTENKQTEITQVKDRNGMVVTETYRVKVQPQPKLAYTVNL